MTRRPAIVVVTERRLFPVNDGNRARIVTLIRSLRTLGFFVVLVTGRPRGVAATLQTRWLADRLFPVDSERFSRGSPSAYDCSSFYEPVRAAVARYSPVAVIAEYIWMAPCLDAVGGGILRIVDTLDLMHVRREFRDRLSNIWVNCTEDEERLLLEKADAILAIQSRELERFRELVPSRTVICVPHYVAVQPTLSATNHPVVTIIGSDNPGNVEGLTAFLAEGWPVVRRMHADAELRIFGQLATTAPTSEGVTRVGYTTNLRRAYRDAAVVINPMRFGTGLKIKTVEALARAKLVVTTSCGAEGLESGAGQAFVVEDDMERFGHAISAFLADRNARRQFESAAAAYAAREFSRERVYGGLLELLASRVPNVERRRLLIEGGS